MKPDYKNWVPKGMLASLGAGAAALGALTAAFGMNGLGTHGKTRAGLTAAAGAGTAALSAATLRLWEMHRAFSYDGRRKLMRDIVEGTAQYVRLPNGGFGLDVGCGSGALTIACALRNPQGTMVGIDRWGQEYASFSRALCEENARAEGARNVSFAQGDACKLPYADETFDAVTSNYVYHNIMGKNKQDLLLETLRVLKKGGTFVIHDLMGPARYGDMQAFVEALRAQGYEDVWLSDTTNDAFMSPEEAKRYFLTGSMLLIGKK